MRSRLLRNTIAAISGLKDERTLAKGPGFVRARAVSHHGLSRSNMPNDSVKAGVRQSHRRETMGAANPLTFVSYLFIPINYFANLLRVRGCGILSRCRDVRPVRVTTLKEHRHYLEDDWLATKQVMPLSQQATFTQSSLQTRFQDDHNVPRHGGVWLCWSRC